MQNKGNDKIIDTSTTALREYIFQALVVVITVAGLQSGVLVLDTFFFPFSFFPPSLIEVWLHALLLHNIWFFSLIFINTRCSTYSSFSRA